MKQKDVVVFLSYKQGKGRHAHLGPHISDQQRDARISFICQIIASFIAR